MVTVAEIDALWSFLGKTSVFVGILVGLVQGIKYLMSLMPSSKLSRRAQEIEQKLKNDYERLNAHDQRLDKIEQDLDETNHKIDQINEGIQRIGKSQIILINHFAKEDGHDEMRKEADELTDYFITR